MSSCHVATASNPNANRGAANATRDSGAIAHPDKRTAERERTANASRGGAASRDSTALG